MTNDIEFRQRIGRRLQQMYRVVLDEELPEDMIDMLCRAGLRMEVDRLEAERVKRLALDATPDPLAPTYRSSRRRQTPIGRGLEQIYGSVLKEDVPQEFIELLCEYGVRRGAEDQGSADEPEPPAEPS